MTKIEIQELLNNAIICLNNANPLGSLYPAIVNKVKELEDALKDAE
jgi:hypothetical protein